MNLLRDIDVFGKRVLVRADLDVNVEQLTIDNSQLTEVTRLQNLKPTVDYLISHNAKQIIIAGHIGRPEGRDEKLSTKNLLEPLEKILGQEIQFQSNVILANEVSPESDPGQARMNENEKIATSLDTLGTRNDNIGVEPLIVLLENLRFWEGEEKNDVEFAKQLASLADVYINEAFGVCHRAHASIVGVPALLPHGAGLHLEEEVGQLTKLIKNPQKPMVAIIGGAKLETKVLVIESLAKVADWVLVGGKLIHQIGDLASQGLALRGYGIKVIVAGSTPDGKDIDDLSINRFVNTIRGAKTIVWNGPMGLFEEGFEKGTMAIAQAVIDSDAYSVVGGGETTEFLGSKNLLSKFSFVSSGGGAMLEYLSGKELPGIKALE